MSDRDRLIELIQNSVNGCARHWAELIADHLLANGLGFGDEELTIRLIELYEEIKKYESLVASKDVVIEDLNKENKRLIEALELSEAELDMIVNVDDRV